MTPPIDRFPYSLRREDYSEEREYERLAEAEDRCREQQKDRELFPKMTTAYFTFCQDHAHQVNGKTFDCDCVVKITSSNPRETMFDHFGAQWAFQYDDLESVKMKYYPRGVIEL